MVLAFATEGEYATWKMCIKVKYGVDLRGWFTRNYKGNYGIILWKAISKEATFLKKRCSFQLGDGERIRFW